MPRYDYFCPACDERVEITHGMFDKITSYCPRCGAVLTKGAPRSMMPVYWPGRPFMEEDGLW